MIRLGILGLDGHAPPFLPFFNGFTEQWRQSYSSHGDTPETIPGARVVAIYGAPGEEQLLHNLVSDFSVPFLAEKPDDMLGKIDAALVLSAKGAPHLPLARPFLQSGLPTFVTKPLADDLPDAAEMVSLAQKHNAPFFSASALRFASELEPLRAAITEKGDVWGGCAFGPLNYSAEKYRYGIHAVEGIVSLLGTGVESVLSVGTNKNHLVRLKYEDGKMVMVVTGNNLGSYDYILWGENWRLSASCSNHYQFFRRTMEAFIDMVRTGRPPVPPEETIEILKIVLAAEKSINTGQEVRIL